MIVGCVRPMPKTLQQQTNAALGAVESLRLGEFDKASFLADKIIEKDARNPFARFTKAVIIYKETMHGLYLDFLTARRVGQLFEFLGYLLNKLTATEKRFVEIEEHLAMIEHKDFSVELCPACWRVDWDNNGRIDGRDDWILEIDLNVHSKKIPKGDPARRPTFRFDHGDILWARAFIAFHQAVINLALSYKLPNLQSAISSRQMDIKLLDKTRVEATKTNLLKGLDLADRARVAYLAETDDDREWVPNPKQKNHPLPLPVDDRLYETWAGIVGDLRRLIHGEEGISVAEVVKLTGLESEQVEGYVDVGKMLREPKDMVVDLTSVGNLLQSSGDDESIKMIFGNYYRKKMKPSPLLGRLDRMRREIDAGSESMSRKLRYLLWLN